MFVVREQGVAFNPTLKNLVKWISLIEFWSPAFERPKRENVNFVLMQSPNDFTPFSVADFLFQKRLIVKGISEIIIRLKLRVFFH